MTTATQASKLGQPQGPLAVVVLADDGFNLFDLAGPLQALAKTNRSALPSAPARCAALVASAAGGAIFTGAGLPVMVESVAPLSDVPIDTLIVPGGCASEEFAVPSALSAFIVSRAGAVRKLCSVCTGAFPLAAAGLLEGRLVETHGRGAAGCRSGIRNSRSIRKVSSSAMATSGRLDVCQCEFGD